MFSFIITLYISSNSNAKNLHQNLLNLYTHASFVTKQHLTYECLYKEAKECIFRIKFLSFKFSYVWKELLMLFPREFSWVSALLDKATSICNSFLLNYKCKNGADTGNICKILLLQHYLNNFLKYFVALSISGMH